MRNLTFGDINFDSKLRGVKGATVSPHSGEGYAILNVDMDGPKAK